MKHVNLCVKINDNSTCDCRDCRGWVKDSSYPRNGLSLDEIDEYTRNHLPQTPAPADNSVVVGVVVCSGVDKAAKHVPNKDTEKACVTRVE